jgi:hypothetical protein
VLEYVLLASLPALGFLVLFFALRRWGRKHDSMGGRRGHIWEPDDVERGPESG